MTPVVIFAGGRGLRLDPLTERYPKPLVGLGGKPLLEQIITRFVRSGFTDIWLTIGYKWQLITEYFGDGDKFGCRIRYIEEEEPLGTAGALHLLPQQNGPIICSNADVVVLELDCRDLLESHAESGADITVCLGVHQQQIPYGVARLVGDRLTHIDEKPIQTWLVSVGIYVLSPWVLSQVPQGHVDMTDLMRSVDKLNPYTIDGHWHHVTRVEDLGWANTFWAHSQERVA